MIARPAVSLSGVCRVVTDGVVSRLPRIWTKMCLENENPPAHSDRVASMGCPPGVGDKRDGVCDHRKG